ncbi:hypothetical protein EYF80_052648 [Liparis tanakae]|uniref:Uncharacterized protein n=1 Tax=Liparis tanakae TaxID=230148 RepID=A0A4Z2F7R5_9TELE|nr:hypothetical protein EYF80_052648 [Liparis tanakae]
MQGASWHRWLEEERTEEGDSWRKKVDRPGCVKEWHFFPGTYARAAPSVGGSQAQQSPSNLLRLSPAPPRPVAVLQQDGRDHRLSSASPPLRHLRRSFPRRGDLGSFRFRNATRHGLYAPRKTLDWSAPPSQRGLPCVLVMRLVAHSRHSIKGIPLCLKKPPQ